MAQHKPKCSIFPQCVTQAYEIHSQGVRIIVLGDQGRDLSCSLYFWAPMSVLTAGSLRRSATASVRHKRLLLQQHPVTGGRVGTAFVAASPLLMSYAEVFAHNSWASCSLQPTITSSSLRPSDA